jgi:hypothetical protein
MRHFDFHTSKTPLSNRHTQALQDPPSTMTKSSKAPIDPLRDFLDAVVTRIETLEQHCGICPHASGSPSALTGSSTHGLEKTPSTRHISGVGKTAASIFDLCGL